MSWSMIIAGLVGVVLGWLLSGIWRGTTKRGYLLALDHVEELLRPGETAHTALSAIKQLREQAAADT